MKSNKQITLPKNAVFEGAVLEPPWKEGAVNSEMAKPGAVRGQKGGAVVSKSVPQLKESVTPPPGIQQHNRRMQCTRTTDIDYRDKRLDKNKTVLNNLNGLRDDFTGRLRRGPLEGWE